MPEREAFRIGPFQIGGLTIDIPVYWYGIMIMLGVIAASLIAFREARRRGEDPDHVWGLFPWVLIAGIAGARIGFIISQLGDPRYQNLGAWFDIRQGGLSIQGAVAGGVVAVLLYARRYKLSFFRWADIIVPGLALAQAIGRLGNYFNQEAFGERTTLPWGIQISPDRQREVAGITNPDPNDRFHPTFAYEMIWDLMNFGLLLWLGRQKLIRLREGDLLWVYLIFYSIGRFVIEGIRLDSATVGTLRTPQLVALITIVIAWTALIYRNRPRSTAPYSESNLTEGEAREQRRAARPVSSQRGRRSRVRRVSMPAGTEEGTPGQANMEVEPPGGSEGPLPEGGRG
jgi:phosphatidylglycerol:prolipoprotein diacylglycerol transferase